MRIEFKEKLEALLNKELVDPACLKLAE